MSEILCDKINLGCGTDLRTGFVNVDWKSGPGVDVVCNLDVLPWPFADNMFSDVCVAHLLEHLENPDRAMTEIFRISRGGATVHVVVPHFSSYQAYGDLSHRRHCSLSILLPYCGESWNSFGASGCKQFRILEKRLTFGSSPLAWPGRLLAWLSPEFYEKYFAFIFPCRNMEFVLVVNK